MTKFLFLFILFIYSNTFSQDIDSLLSPVPRDTIITEDSTMVRDTTTAQDTTGIFDSAKTAAVVDTLFPINQRVLYRGSTFMGQETLKDLYSAYEGNSLQESERIFIRDYAFLGYPDEIFYYGTNSVSLLEDGLALNNLFGYTNTNHILMESVDSIEFVPAVRGFMYGQTLNQTSINFISRDFLSQSPYTKIRYYEGLVREGMVSGIFNSLIFNKVNVYADITNRSSDPRYFNSDLSSWQGKLKAKYFLSNKVNLLAAYNFNHFFSGLNGGVDVDSIASVTDNIGNVLFDEILAPVVFRTRQLEDKQHLLRLRLLALPSTDMFSDFSIYYSFSQLRVFANDDLNASDFAYKSKSIGAYLDQRYQYGLYSFELRGDYNHSDIQLNLYEPGTPVNKFDYDTYSLSGGASVDLLDSLITPSIFYRLGKTNAMQSDNQSGAGADLLIHPLNFLTLYTGYSFYDNLFNDLTGTMFQAGGYALFGFLKVKGEYYSRDNFQRPLYFGGSGNMYGLLNIYPAQVNHNGINGSIELKIWSFLLSSSINYPFLSEGRVTGLPQLFSRSGFYFKDQLFSNSLDLKTGFTLYYTGEQYLTSDQIKTDYSTEYVPEAYRIDYTFSGEIQKLAILFFTWENITDNQYYITPYYPMPFSGFKFGISWELSN